jgi:hypothetical protein
VARAIELGARGITPIASTSGLTGNLRSLSSITNVPDSSGATAPCGMMRARGVTSVACRATGAATSNVCWEQSALDTAMAAVPQVLLERRYRA